MQPPEPLDEAPASAELEGTPELLLELELPLLLEVLLVTPLLLLPLPLLLEVLLVTPLLLEVLLVTPLLLELPLMTPPPEVSESLLPEVLLPTSLPLLELVESLPASPSGIPLSGQRVDGSCLPGTYASSGTSEGSETQPPELLPTLKAQKRKQIMGVPPSGAPGEPELDGVPDDEVTPDEDEPDEDEPDEDELEEDPAAALRLLCVCTGDPGSPAQARTDVASRTDRPITPAVCMPASISAPSLLSPLRGRAHVASSTRPIADPRVPTHRGA